MNTKPIDICRLIRRMRGGSHSLLVEGNDRRFYVAKFLGNPQGARTLINELFAFQLIRLLGIATPELRLLTTSDRSPADVARLQLGCHGLIHLGSEFPGHPERVATFDYLSPKHYSGISNLNEFAAMFVIDRFLHNSDRRQAIYIRNRKSGPIHFRASFIDHGMIFQGSSWQLGNVPGHGLASPQEIYSLIEMSKVSKTVVDRIQSLTREDLLKPLNFIPHSWYRDNDERQFTELVNRLIVRQAHLGNLVKHHLSSLGLSR